MIEDSEHILKKDIKFLRADRIEVGPDNISIRDDSRNNFLAYLRFLNHPEKALAGLRKRGFQPIKHYREYHEDFDFTEDELKYILKYSDPKSIQTYNEVANILNETLPCMMQSVQSDRNKMEKIKKIIQPALKKLASLHPNWAYIQELKNETIA